MNAGFAYAKSLTLGNTTGHGANATTGSAQHMMGKPVVVMACVTVASANVIRAGLEKPVSTSRTASSPAERAKTCAATLREWCAPTQERVSVAAACATTPTAKASSVGATVSVMTASAWMRTQERCVEAMESVTVETVTARPVGMEINVNSSVTSAHGKASGDAHLQTAKSAATEGHVYAENVHAMMWTHPETGVTSMETPASVTRGAATQHMTDIQMISALVMVSVIAGGVTVKRVGQARSVSILSPVPFLQRPA